MQKKYIGLTVCLSFFLITLIQQAHATTASPIAEREFYISRYALPDVFQKLVDNRGKGFEDLYGTRNFRTVLQGVAYRGGANNAYHRTNKRHNSNPLPEDGLKNLCEEGFSQAIYLYTTNFETASPQKQCASLTKKHQVLNYAQLNPRAQKGVYDILVHVHQSIIDPSRGPVYVHCWNGWHASGLASALILRQFCGVSAKAAVTYWDQNTDGNNTSSRYETIRQQIRDFKPYSELQIPNSVQSEICPTL